MAFEGFLTSVYAGEDVSRPTFFELIAQEQLMDALRPAVRFVVTMHADRTPPRLAPLAAHWEVFYEAFLLLLEGYHLRAHGASFAEHFFGLCRRELAPQRKLTPLEVVELERRRQSSPGLTRRQQLLSLVFLVMLPWLRSRCEARFKEAEAVPDAARTPWQQRWVRLYPWVHAASHGAAMAYRLLYLLGRTDVWSPGLRVLGMQLVRHFPEPPLPPGGEEEVKSRVRRLWELVSTAGTAALWSGVYGMQFAQWWSQREHLLQPYQPRLVPPPPPPRWPYGEVPAQVTLKGSDKGVGSRLVLLPQDRTICAICHRVRRNPAVSVSGYVFCYPCLLPYVQKYGHCPVTGSPMAPTQVRRIRDDSNDM